MGMDKAQIQGYIRTFLTGVRAPKEVIEGLDMFFAIKWKKPMPAKRVDLVAIDQLLNTRETHVFTGVDERGRKFVVLVQSEPGALPPQIVEWITK